jgi:hypothetical protein
MTAAHLPLDMEGVKERAEWQTRLINERYDLSEKLNRLLRHLALGDEPTPPNSILSKQAKAMKRYLWCLDQRIATFIPAAKK